MLVPQYKKIDHGGVTKKVISKIGSTDFVLTYVNQYAKFQNNNWQNNISLSGPKVEYSKVANLVMFQNDGLFTFVCITQLFTLKNSNQLYSEKTEKNSVEKPNKYSLKLEIH